MSDGRFERYLVAINRAIIFVMMAVMATLVFVNVIARYVLNFSIIWAEEVSQYLMIWIAYLGAGLALRECQLAIGDRYLDMTTLRVEIEVS